MSSASLSTSSCAKVTSRPEDPKTASSTTLSEAPWSVWMTVNVAAPLRGRLAGRRGSVAGRRAVLTWRRETDVLALPVVEELLGAEHVPRLGGGDAVDGLKVLVQEAEEALGVGQERL